LNLFIPFYFSLFIGQPSSNQDPKEAFKDQNQQLKDMGFTNDDLNLEVLKQTGGNVDAAVERLLNMLN
jgi:ubiquilin